MRLGTVISRLDKLPISIKKEIEAIMLDLPSKLNRNQLKDGKDSNNEDLTFRDGRLTYSNEYAKKRRVKGLQTKHYDLKFTGDFYKSIKTKKKTNNIYENISNDSKYQKIKENFKNNESILGLNTISINEMKFKIKDKIETIIKNTFK